MNWLLSTSPAFSLALTPPQTCLLPSLHVLMLNYLHLFPCTVFPQTPGPLYQWISLPGNIFLPHLPQLIWRNSFLSVKTQLLHERHQFLAPFTSLRLRWGLLLRAFRASTTPVAHVGTDCRVSPLVCPCLRVDTRPSSSLCLQLEGWEPQKICLLRRWLGALMLSTGKKTV